MDLWHTKFEKRHLLLRQTFVRQTTMSNASLWHESAFYFPSTYFLQTFKSIHFYLDRYPLDFDQLLPWHDSPSTQFWLWPTPTSTVPLLVELYKNKNKRFLSIKTYRMKNTFHRLVTWDKHLNNYTVTYSKYYITKVLSKTCVDHFADKNWNFYTTKYLWILCVFQ